jgi:predicted NAD/FAD-binding protein
MKVKYKGKTYETKIQLAKELGINYDTLNMRMSRGLSLKQAIEFKPKSAFKFKKVSYNSYPEMIEKLGLDLSVGQLQYRLRKCNGSLVKAINYKVKDRTIVYKRKSYKNLRDLCDKLDVNYSAIRNRMNVQNMTLEESIKASEKGGLKRGRKKVA